ncbi:hypothetical protein BH713_14590 [Enterobacter kobei]|uniref:Uncharacterized protein n=1 Tax=Enterobacter kobei TaxID=208224 RepID=A0ACC8S2L1_9ENTR|nr:hypothetical protein BH713_14590 [Enterobacter kobei]
MPFLFLFIGHTVNKVDYMAMGISFNIQGEGNFGISYCGSTKYLHNISKILSIYPCDMDYKKSKHQ